MIPETPPNSPFSEADQTLVSAANLLTDVQEPAARWSAYDPSKRRDRRALRAQAEAVCRRASRLSDKQMRSTSHILGEFIDKMPACNKYSKTKVQLQYWHRYTLAVQYARKPSSDLALALAQPPARPQGHLRSNHRVIVREWETSDLCGQRAAYSAALRESSPHSEAAALASIHGAFIGDRLDEAKEMMAALSFFLRGNEDDRAIEAWRRLWLLGQAPLCLYI